jgi:hypothetical protein
MKWAFMQSYNKPFNNRAGQQLEVGKLWNPVLVELIRHKALGVKVWGSK